MSKYNHYELELLIQLLTQYSLGHFFLLQSSFTTVLPSHSLPPYCAGGLLHCLWRARTPTPHVLLHSSHDSQGPHLPSTKNKKKSIFIVYSEEFVSKVLEYFCSGVICRTKKRKQNKNIKIENNIKIESKPISLFKHIQLLLIATSSS